MLVPVLYQILQAVPAQGKVALTGDDAAVGSFLISDYVTDLGQSYTDTGPVIIAQSFLDVVGLEHRVGNICIIGRFSEKTGKYAVIVEHAVVVKIRTVIHNSSPCDLDLCSAKI